MAAQKLTCPECETKLNLPRAVEPGKKVKCPKCGTRFAVPEGPAPKAGTAVTAKKPAAAKDKPKDKSKSKPEPAAAPKKPPDDDEDGPATYGVVQEPEPEEDEDEDDEDEDDEDEDDEDRPKKKKKNKPDLTFALDTSIKDPRGPAQALIIRPTNWLMIFSSLNILGCAILWFIFLFPFVFSDSFVPDEEYAKIMDLKLKEDQAINRKGKTELTDDEKAKLAPFEMANMTICLIWVISMTIEIAIQGLIIFGCVKAQMLESYAWGMVAAIVAIVTGGLISIALGIWVLIVLNQPEVKKGFEFKSELD
jgi:hypothetical protein